MPKYLCDTTICEGYNDKIYFINFIDKPCNVRFPKINSTPENKVVRTIVNKSIQNYLEKLESGQCKKILITNGGLNTTIDHLIPSMVRKLVAMDSEKTIRIIFDDGGNPDKIIKTFKEKLGHKLFRSAVTGEYKLFKDDDDWYVIDYYFDTKKESSVKIKILFVPNSLEKQIVKKALEIHGTTFGKNKCKELEILDPHMAIIEISKLLKGPSYVNKEDEKHCIHLASKECWLIEEEWHKSIIHEI